MRRLAIFLMFFSFICGVGVVQAASQAPVTMKSATDKPKIDSNTLLINARQKNQWKLMQTGLKSQKITKEQAQGIRSNLKNVRLQELKFFKLNTKPMLTQDQLSQLNSLLDKNSSLLGETPSSSN